MNETIQLKESTMNTIPAHLLERVRATQEARAKEAEVEETESEKGSGIEKDWNGASAKVLEILKASPGKIYTYQALSTLAGLTRTQIQCATLHLTRSGEFISKPRTGTVRWTPVFEPTPLQMKQLVFLYEDLYENSVQGPDDPFPVYNGAIVRALANRSKKYFRVNSKFSKNSLMTTFRLLVNLDCVTYESDRQFYKKYLLQTPYEALGLPTPNRRGRKRKNVPEPLRVAQVAPFVEPETVEAKEAEWVDVDPGAAKPVGEDLQRVVRAFWTDTSGRVYSSEGTTEDDWTDDNVQVITEESEKRFDKVLNDFNERHPKEKQEGESFTGEFVGEVVGYTNAGNKLVRYGGRFYELTPI